MPRKLRIIRFVFALTLLGAAGIGQQQKKPLTNTDVVNMVKVGLSENTIILAIQKSDTQFDTSADALIKLKRQGVPEKVIDAVLNSQGASTERGGSGEASPSTGMRDAATHLQRAKDLYGHSEWDAALGEFREAARLEPNNAEAHLGICRALTLSNAPDRDEAINECRRAILLKPDSAAAHQFLGNMLVDKVQQQFGQFHGGHDRDGNVIQPDGTKPGAQPALDEARGELKESVRLSPNDAGPHVSLALELWYEGHLQEAIRECREAIRLDPDNAWAHTDLGGILDIAGDPTGAAIELQTACRLDSHECSSYRFRFGNSGQLGGGPAAASNANVSGSGSAQFAPDQRDIIRRSVDNIRSGPHAEMPPPQASPTGQGGGTSMTVKNDTTYGLTVYLTGPASRSLQVSAGESQIVGLPPGRYEVAAKVSNPGVLPFYGVQNYGADTRYSEDFYVSEGAR
jgi:Flp pilus assembly protein TadD